MTLPAYWWLLALSIVFQGAFFVRIPILRMCGKGVQPLSRPAKAVVFVSATAGLIYGVVQRDPLFFVGQLCLIFIYFKMFRSDDDAAE